MKIGTSTAFHSVEQREIADGLECLVVAEFGLNHNGSIEGALDMVREAAAQGCPAIKVQAYSADEFTSATATYTYQQAGPDGEPVIITELQRDMFKRCELPLEGFQAIRDECRRLGLYWIATATDPVWIERMMVLGVDALKVGSDDITHVPLLRRLRGLGVPVILSTGMATESEVARAVDEAQPAALLHCVSLYPTPPDAVNLGRMEALRKFGLPVGFSDHTATTPAAMIAMARGAAIVEKHFTLDNALPGPDHWFSAVPEDLGILCQWAEYVPVVVAARGIAPDEREASMANIARRSIVAARYLPAWHLISADDLAYRRPGTGMSPAEVDDVIGTFTAKPVAAGAQITPRFLAGFRTASRES